MTAEPTTITTPMTTLSTVTGVDWTTTVGSEENSTSSVTTSPDATAVGSEENSTSSVTASSDASTAASDDDSDVRSGATADPAPSPTAATEEPGAEQNRAASSIDDDDAGWWVPVVIVCLFLAVLLGMMLMWRRREQANADVIRDLKNARNESSATMPNAAFNPDIAAGTLAAGDLPLASFDNPTYDGTGGYLEVGDDGTAATGGDDVTYALPLETGSASIMYDTVEPDGIGIDAATPTYGDDTYAIPMEAGGIALGNTRAGYATAIIDSDGTYSSASVQYVPSHTGAEDATYALQSSV